MKIELLWLPGCPHVDAARALLRRCLDRLGLDSTVTERTGEYPSPTVLVDGRDVMGEPAAAGASCRLDVPSEGGVMAALLASTRVRP